MDSPLVINLLTLIERCMHPQAVGLKAFDKIQCSEKRKAWAILVRYIKSSKLVTNEYRCLI